MSKMFCAEWMRFIRWCMWWYSYVILINISNRFIPRASGIPNAFTGTGTMSCCWWWHVRRTSCWISLEGTAPIGRDSVMCCCNCCKSFCCSINCFSYCSSCCCCCASAFKSCFSVSLVILVHFLLRCFGACFVVLFRVCCFFLEEEELNTADFFSCARCVPWSSRAVFFMVSSVKFQQHTFLILWSTNAASLGRTVARFCSDSFAVDGLDRWSQLLSVWVVATTWGTNSTEKSIDDLGSEQM